MVHDGDQNKSGGDTGEACINVVIPGTAGLTLFCPANAGFLNVPYSSAIHRDRWHAALLLLDHQRSASPGLSLNTSTGAVTGTPTTTGTFNFTAQVRGFGRAISLP